MIKLKRVVTDKGFILEEIEKDKINKQLNDEGKVKTLDLPHVEDNPESVQAHIDAVKEIVDKEKEEMEKKALETKSEDRAIFAESKLFKNRNEMSEFIVQLKEQKIKHRVVPLHEDKEGYRFELKYEKPLNTELNESYETAFEVCEDGSKVSAVGSFKHTRNYTHELVDFECASGSGSGDYRWMNRPWQRFTFAEALREAMINAGVDEKCAKDCIENSYSLKSAIKYFAENCCKKEEVKPEESLKEKKDNGRCPHCGSENIDFVDSDEDSTKYVCRDCGQDYLVLDDGEVTDRHNRPIESLKEDKNDKLETYEDKIDFLLGDEDEAISGYDKILAMLDEEEDSNVIEQLNHIKEEELAHKKFLELVKKDKEAIYEHKNEEEDEDDFEEVEETEEEDDFDWNPSLDDEQDFSEESMWDDLED